MDFSFKSIRKPRLTRTQKQWKISHSNVDTDDINYPLEVIEDGYKMVRTYRQEARKYKGSEIPSANLVEWGWKFTVKNKSRKDLIVTVTYKLVDKDFFVVTFANNLWGDKWIKAGKTVTFQNTSTMNYDEVRRVVGSTWNISYREPEKKKTTLEKLFR